MQDPIADMFTRIRNNQFSNKISVSMYSSRLKVAISKVLKKEGFILDYTVIKKSKLWFLEIMLKYFKGKPVIEMIKRVSKPSLRIYRDKYNLPKVMDGLGVSIISTSKGLITDRDARKIGIGGEVICYVA